MFDNRRHLIQIACRLFADRGYDAVGVQELVTQAGVTKPTLYHYFGSKQGILEAVLADYFEPFYKILLSHSVYQGDLVHSLEIITNDYLIFASTEPVFFRLWMTMRFAPVESIAYQCFSPYLNQQQTLIRNLFIKAAEQHGNMRNRQDSYTITFLGMIFTYASLALQDSSTMDDSLVYRAVHQFMYGIFS